MKKFMLSAAITAATAAPAFAGDGGGTTDTGALLIQAIGRMLGKIAGWF
jgi:hypothetical protein